MKKVDIIIYSKNRAAQLDLLLRSIKENFLNVNKVFVLNDFDDDFKKSYEKLWAKDYGINVEYIYQNKSIFYNVLLDVLKRSDQEWVLPFCDDDVVISKADVDGALEFVDGNTTGLNLRFSLDMDISYHTGAIVPFPAFERVGDFCKWKWKGASDLRWGYPYHAGGKIYRKDFFYHMMSTTEFDNPNILEYKMMVNKDNWGKECSVCFKSAPIVNVSVNRVQNVSNNRGGRDVGYSPQELRDRFMNGECIDLKPLQDMKPNCEFIEIQLDFIKE